MEKWTERITPNHHAYLVQGSIEPSRLELIQFLEDKWKIGLAGNPDFIERHFGVLTIDDSRNIALINSTKPVGEKRIVLFSAESATREAQNSLLKTLEEPGHNTFFFFIFGNTGKLLRTLQSRLQLINTGENATRANEEAVKFISADRKSKMAIVEKMAKDLSDEKITRHFALEFVEAIELEIWTSPLKRNPEYQNAIAKTKKYAGDKSASYKLILSHLALILPVK